MGKKRKVRIGRSGRSLSPTLSPRDLRERAIKDPGLFADNMDAAIEEDDISWQSLSRAGVSMRDLYKALADVPVETGMPDMTGRTRAVMTSAFPLLAGNLTAQALEMGFEQHETIGEQLVRELDSNKKNEIVARVVASNPPEGGVKEGDPYPLMGATEDWVNIGHRRDGFRMAITQETLDEIDIPGFLNMLWQGAEIASNRIEQQTLDRVTDKNGSNTTAAAAPYAFKPQGTPTQLYNATANNPGVRAPSGTRITNTPLAGVDDLETARAHFASYRDDRGKRTNRWTNDGSMIALVPDARRTTLESILNSVDVPGVVGERNVFGPQGSQKITPLSSPLLDNITTVDWWLGRFNRQFVRKWMLRLENFSIAMDPAAFLMSRVAWQGRLGWDVEIGAEDYTWVVQLLEGTTYTPS